MKGKKFTVAGRLSVWQLVLLLTFFTTGTFGIVSAQDRYAIERVQAQVRDQILNEQGAGRGSVVFPQNVRVEIYPISNVQSSIRGRGVYSRDFNAPPQSFSYDATWNTRSGRVERVSYRFDDANNAEDVPTWLTGQFTGRNPITGVRMTITVTPAGEVTALYDNGAREGGSVYGNSIRLGAATWDVTQTDNGFRVRGGGRTERFDRLTIPIGDRVDRCTVPRWMTGRFRGQTNSGESELVISADGSANIRSLRSNRTFYGRYADGILTFDFGSFGVAREGDGIRTLAVNNPSDQTTYSRVF